MVCDFYCLIIHLYGQLLEQNPTRYIFLCISAFLSQCMIRKPFISLLILLWPNFNFKGHTKRSLHTRHLLEAVVSHHSICLMDASGMEYPGACSWYLYLTHCKVPARWLSIAVKGHQLASLSTQKLETAFICGFYACLLFLWCMTT